MTTTILTVLASFIGYGISAWLYRLIRRYLTRRVTITELHPTTRHHKAA